VDWEKNKRKRARGWLEPGRGLKLFLGFPTAIPGKGQLITTSCWLALSVVAHPPSASLIFATTPLAQHSHACIQAPSAPTRVAKQVAKNGHLRLAQSVFHLSHTVGDIQAFVST
jgi:hypothetical protein